MHFRHPPSPTSSFALTQSDVWVNPFIFMCLPLLRIGIKGAATVRATAAGEESATKMTSSDMRNHIDAAAEGGVLYRETRRCCCVTVIQWVLLCTARRVQLEKPKSLHPVHRHCHDNMKQFCYKAVPVMCTPVSHGIFLTLITCNMADGSIPRALSEDLNDI